MKQIKKTKSILHRYFFSYLGAVMLAGSIISGILFSISVKGIMKANTNTAVSNLNNAAADFQLQYDLMNDITKKIRLELCYKPSYFLRNKYYETELLSSLSKYESYSPIVQEYFLYYHDFSTMYSGQGTSIDIDTYFLRKLKWKDYQTVWQEIQQSRQPTVLVTNESGEDYVIFVFPIEISSSSTSSSATVVFIVSHSILQTRMMTFGINDKPVLFTCDGKSLFFITDERVYKEPPEEFINLSDSDKICSTLSPELQFQLSGSTEQIVDQTILRNYRLTISIVVVLIVPLLLCLAIILAYESYRPIKKLQGLVVDADRDGVGNEFNRIADAFDKLREKEKIYQKDINQQKGALKHQMVDIILNGGINRMIQGKALEMGIILSKDCYYVLAANMGQIENKNIYDELEGLRDLLSCDLFMGELGADRCISLLIGISHIQRNKDSFLHIISDFFDGLALEAFVGCSRGVENIDKLSVALLEAHSALYEARCTGEKIVVFEDVEKDQDTFLQLDNMPSVVYELLKRGKLSEIQINLQQCLDLLNSKKQSTIFLRYFYNNMMLALNKYARELGTGLTQEQSLAIITSPSVESFIHAYSEVVYWLYSFMLNRSSKVVNDAEEIIGFIQLNFCDYDMSLELLKEKFGYNIPQLSGIIKNALGVPFRSYLVSLRMEKAKELLKTQHTVAEISSMVGYSSVSHFIKTFRTYFGDKPSQFRK